MRNFKFNLEMLPKMGEKSLSVKCISRGDIDGLKLLIEKGTNINEVDDNGRTLLHMAVFSSQSDSIKAEMIKELIKAGVNPDISDRWGITPLFMALENRFYSEYDNLPVISALVKCKVNLNKPNPKGETPLSYSVLNLDDKVSTMLIQNGANPHEISKNGYNLIHKAVIKNRSETIKSLVKAGVNPNDRDNSYKTPFYIALERRFDFGVDNLNAIRALAECGININKRELFGKSPLCNCIIHGDTKLLELLIEKGANVHEVNVDGWNLLHMSVWRKQPLITAILVKAGVNSHQKNNNKLTPLELGQKCYPNDQNYINELKSILQPAILNKRMQIDEKIDGREKIMSI